MIGGGSYIFVVKRGSIGGSSFQWPDTENQDVQVSWLRILAVQPSSIYLEYSYTFFITSTCKSHQLYAISDRSSTQEVEKRHRPSQESFSDLVGAYLSLLPLRTIFRELPGS